ncbi:TPA: transcriptional regulator [Escherichia coli]
MFHFCGRVTFSFLCYKWLHNKAKVSPEHVGSIVTATGGVVKAYQIRPDLPKLFPHTEKNAA